MADVGQELARVRCERELYRWRLDLGRGDEPEWFLREALGVIVEVTEARQGYRERYADDLTGAPRWSLAHDFTTEQFAGVRAALSRGIIAEVVARRTTSVTPSALLDARCRERESVQLGHHRSGAIGDDPPRGVLYLHICAGHRFFTKDDRVTAEMVARPLAPLVDRVLGEPLTRVHEPGAQGPRHHRLAAGLREVGSALGDGITVRPTNGLQASFELAASELMVADPVAAGKKYPDLFHWKAVVDAQRRLATP